MTAILTNSGRTALATALMLRSIHLAWGTGLPEWDDTPYPEQMDAEGLVAEVGRRKATSVLYATPDGDGSIVVPNGRFSLSDEPTPFIFAQFDFDYDDASDATIREIAVFSGSTVDPSLPPGQMYFAPGEITNPGTLVVLEHVEKIPRSQNVQQAFRFVIEI